MKGEPLFGTDGVRGIPGRGSLAPAMVRKIGAAAGAELLAASVKSNGRKPVVLIGRDTRASGTALARDLARGLNAAGAAVIDAGVLPTPAVSYLVPKNNAVGGAVISASHNPPEFNGIKFFRSDGYKISERLERRIEAAVARMEDPGLGGVKVEKDSDSIEDYLDFLKSTFPVEADLTGLRIVVDCANGAAAAVAPALFEGLGAKVFPVGISPNGKNINQGCGATAPERMQREVVSRRADCGVALDGDADRCVLADERGVLLDGDSLIALTALEMSASGGLRGSAVVLTVMSNLGLVKFLRERGIGRIEVPVGDRNVTEALERHDLVLGGENSGHIVFRKFAPTGDGLLTALQTIAAWQRTGGRLSRSRGLYRPFPQILRGVRIERKIPLEGLPGFQRSVERARRALRDEGRVFVRYSGTEPLLRILVEGSDGPLVRRLSEELERDFSREAERRKD